MVNQKSYMGWTNKDTYLYCLTIDDYENSSPQKNIRLIANSSCGIKEKRVLLIKVFLDIGNKEVNLEQVNFEEIVQEYKQ